MSCSIQMSCRVSGPTNEIRHESRRGGKATRSQPVGNALVVEDSIIGCRCVIEAGFERRNENVRDVWAGLLGIKG